MTTIVANRKEMACDRQFTKGDYLKFKGHTKIYRCPAHEATYPDCGFIMGLAGKSEDIILLSDFFTNPDLVTPPKKLGGMDGLILTEEGKIYQFAGSPVAWLLVDEPFSAIGSGASYALGVMAAGGTVREAIKAATKYDPFTGMGVRIITR